MKNPHAALNSFVVLALLTLCACSRQESEPAVGTNAHRHDHHPPHGGTAVVLGAEAYHLELVRDAATGALQAYVLDGEMDNFIRIAETSFAIDAVVNHSAQALTLHPVANSATGETVGDTALFEGQVEWLKTSENFDATLRSITIRGTTFIDVKFNFPQGNDRE